MPIKTIMRACTDFIRMKLRNFIIGILNQVSIKFQLNIHIGHYLQLILPEISTIQFICEILKFELLFSMEMKRH